MEAEIDRNRCDDQIYQQQKQQQTQLYSSRGYNFMSKGKHIMEDHGWDGNNWEWDSNRFIARPLNIDKGSGFQGKQLLSDGPQSAHGISSDMYNKNDDAYNNGFHSYNMNDASEKRRKVSVVEEEETAEEEAAAAACLTLKLGGSDYPVAETDVDAASGGSKNGKRSRGLPASSHHYPMCQVDDCKADLNNAKDYHRRHKVCEMHAKENKALVGRLMQRFCQQCSSVVTGAGMASLGKGGSFNVIISLFSFATETEGRSLRKRHTTAQSSTLEVGYFSLHARITNSTKDFAAVA